MCPTLAVTITALPNSGTPPLTVFLSSFPAGGLPPYTFLWDFGDGSPNATTQNAVHTYVQGDFAATCTVTDTLGRSVTSPPAPLTVSPVVPPASFTIQQDQVCVASGPAPLQQLPAGPSLESIPAGPALEAIPATYYDRCLGEFIGAERGTGVGVRQHYLQPGRQPHDRADVRGRHRVAEHGQPEHLDRAPDVRHEHLVAGLPVRRRVACRGAGHPVQRGELDCGDAVRQRYDMGQHHGPRRRLRGHEHARHRGNRVRRGRRVQPRGRDRACSQSARRTGA